MAMKNQKGIVRYQGRDDIVCSYGIRDDGKQFYYLDVNNAAFKNGCRVASTALVEAVDPMVKASNVGLIDREGKEVIPFNNRSIRSVNEDVILVEPAVPTSNSVIEAIQLKSDPLAATKLVSTPALIKDKLNAQIGDEGRYLFNDQFSEATVCDINGNNLVNDEKYSFIATDGKSLYFSKNTADSDITSYSLLSPEVQSNVISDNDSQEIDVSEVEVNQDVIESALSGNAGDDSFEENKDEVPGSMKADESNDEVASSETDVTPVDEDLTESSVEDLEGESLENVSMTTPAEEVVQENPISTEEMVENTSEDNNEADSMDDVVEEKVEDSAVSEPDSFDVPVVPVEDYNAGDERSTDKLTDEIHDIVSDNNDVEEEPADTIVENKGNVDYSELQTADNTFDVPEDLLKVDDDLSDDEVFYQDNLVDSVDTSDVSASDDISQIDLGSFNNTEPVSEEVVETDDTNIFDDVSFDDFDTEDHDIFENSYVNVDHIDVDDFDDSVSDVDITPSTNKGNIMVDAAKTMTAMMNKIREQEAELNETKGELNKSREANTKLKKMTYLLKEKVEAQQNKLASSEAHCAQLESKYNMLEGRLREQNRVINSQAQELEVLRPYAQGEEEMADIIASSKELLGAKVR